MTRQSSHILMTSRRCAESLNIQCLPSSLAATRSIVLLTPNGLPQRMQWNGSSSLSTRAVAVAARKSSCGLQRDHLLRAGRLAQPALHAGILGEAQHRPLGIVDERAGRAGRHAGEAERAALDIDLDRAERRARGQRDRHRPARARRAAVRAAQAACTSRLPPTGRKLAGRGAAAAAAIARSASPSASGSSVSIVATRPPPKPRPARIGSASAMVLRKPGDVVARLGAQQKAHRRRAIGERRRDRFQPDLRHLVDRERQHVRRQAVAVARQRVDQRRAVRVVVQQHDRLARRRPRDRSSAARAACASAHRPAAARRPRRRSGRRRRIGRSRRRSARRSRRDRRRA